MFFENNLPHPLTERTPVSLIAFAGHAISNEAWNLGHPPVINVNSGLVRFNHDIFQGFKATFFGALSVTLLKDEEESEEGHKPLGIIYIEDNYRNKNESKKLTCTL